MGSFQKKIWKKRLWALFSSPMTFYPIIAGATLGLGLWGLSIRSAIGAIAAVGSVVLGAGIFFQRLLTGSRKIDEQVFAELQQEQDAARDEKLDELDALLSQDRDTRDETLLREMRDIVAAFKSSHGTSNLNDFSSGSVAGKVDELLMHCASTLRRSYELKSQVGNGRSASSRALRDERERLLGEVEATIRRLESVFSGAQNLNASQQQANSPLKAICDQLDTSLEVARRVDERMRDLGGSGIGIRTSEQEL